MVANYERRVINGSHETRNVCRVAVSSSAARHGAAFPKSCAAQGILPIKIMSRRHRHARDDVQAGAVQNMHSIAIILRILRRSAAKWVQRLDAKCNRSALSKATRQPSFMSVRLWQHLLEPSVRVSWPILC